MAGESPVSKALAKMQATLQQRAGETAMDLWRLYEAMRPEERAALKAWIDKVAPLAGQMSPCNLLASLHVDLRYPVGPEEDIHLRDVPVGVIRWVLDGWERGEKPTKPTLADLGLGV